MAKIGSKELLMQTFKEISREKSVSKITIKELTDRSGLSKPTFYKYFADKNELIYQLCYKEGRMALFSADTDGTGYENAIISYYKSALESSYYYRSFRYDVDLQVLLYKSIFITGKEYILERLGRTSEDISLDLDVAITFFSAGGAHIFLQWINNNMKESPEELASSICKSIPPELKEIINFQSAF